MFSKLLLIAGIFLFKRTSHYFKLSSIKQITCVGSPELFVTKKLEDYESRTFRCVFTEKGLEVPSNSQDTLCPQ